MKLKQVLSLVVFTVAFNASAAPVFTSKNWSLDDQGSYCVASTSVKVGTEIYRFEAVLEKSGLAPIEFYVRPPAPQNLTLAFTAPLDERKKIIYTFGNLPTTDGSQIFWLIPRATDSFVTFLRKNDSVPMRLIENATTKSFAFSLSGSTATLEKLMTLCHPKKNIDILEFEKNFLPNLVTTIDPKKVTGDISARLRSSFFAGYRAFITKGNLDSELAKLKTDFAKQTKELAEVNKTLEKLEKKDLPPLVAKRSELEARNKALDEQIAALQKSINDSTNQLPAAEADLSAAEKIVAPVRPEYERRQGLVDSAERSLSQARNRLSTIDSRISTLETEIRNLTSELTNLRNSVSSKQSELTRSESVLREAQRENSRFIESSEVQDRLRRDSSYLNAQNEVQRLERELQNKQGEKGRLMNEVNRRRQDLRQCETQAGADCVRQRGDLNRAESDLRSLESTISSLEWSLRSKQDDLRRIENRIRDNVRSEKQNLQEREDRAQDSVDSLQGQIREIESRASTISQVSIPTRQNELTGLRAERPAVNSEIRNSQSDLAQRESELESWKRSVDFDTKWNNFQAAKRRRDGIKNEISELTSEKSNAINARARNESEIANVIAQTEKLNLEISKVRARKNELDAALAGFNSEQERLTREIQSASSIVEQQKKEFAGALPK